MSVNRWWAALLCCAALVRPSLAEDAPDKPATPSGSEKSPTEKSEQANTSYAEPPLHRWGGFDVSVAAWNPSLYGANYGVAAQVIGGSTGTVQVLDVPHDSLIRNALAATWILPHAIGGVRFSYDSIHNRSDLERLTPGTFDFYETAVQSEFAGVGDDGLADGFRASTITKSRIFRLEYANTAFESSHAKGTWHAGLHFVDHSRSLDAEYFALAPNLPPLIPPLGNFTGLIPQSDVAKIRSNFSGQGVGAGMDLAFTVHPRISILAGLSVGVVVGTLRTEAASTTHFYFNTGGDVLGVGVITLDQLRAALDDSTAAGFIVQVRAVADVRDDYGTQAAEDFDAYIGIEGKVLHQLRVYAQYRALGFLNAGVDPRPYLSTSSTSQSAAYRGFVLGLTYRF
jgi:hypothetical protein